MTTYIDLFGSKMRVIGKGRILEDGVVLTLASENGTTVTVYVDRADALDFCEGLEQATAAMRAAHESQVNTALAAAEEASV